MRHAVYGFRRSCPSVRSMSLSFQFHAAGVRPCDSVSFFYLSVVSSLYLCCSFHPSLSMPIPLCLFSLCVSLCASLTPSRLVHLLLPASVHRRANVVGSLFLSPDRPFSPPRLPRPPVPTRRAKPCCTPSFSTAATTAAWTRAPACAAMFSRERKSSSYSTTKSDLKQRELLFLRDPFPTSAHRMVRRAGWPRSGVRSGRCKETLQACVVRARGWHRWKAHDLLHSP